jgi:ABC-type amino acid transport substrate-binding protein
VTGDAFTQLDEVLLGRADVALNDVPTVLQYVRAHRGKVEALWLENPPSMVPGSFVARKGDFRTKSFLDASVRALIADGTLARLDQKWRGMGLLPSATLVPGAGLRSSEAPPMP